MRDEARILRRAAPVLAVAAVAVLGLWLAAKERTYVGASTCKLCHKAELQGRQYVIWESSPHSRAYANLATAAADEIAKQAGIAGPQTNAQCLGCHAPLGDKAPELKSEGVTCEVCHGPGSDYKKLNIMMDREKAVQNGLVLYPDPGAIQAHCLKCHQSAHGKTFDFRAAWDTIKHYLPAK
jgi:hypothetical protein